MCLCRKFPRILKLHDEYFDWIDEPQKVISDLKSDGVGADIFTFVERGVSEATPKYEFYHEWEEIAVLHFDSYDDWFKRQLKTQERNRIKKAFKSKLEVKVVDFNDDLVAGIKKIFDESPVRQGRHNWHYNKSLETVKKETGTFLDRSQFIGAFFQGELIGFVKVMYDGDVAYLMQIIAMIAHRDKAPTNALLAKTVELCAKKGVHYLRYGNWSRRGLGDFKRNHAFQRVEVPRYFIPLNSKGKLALRLKLHRELVDLVPPKLMDVALGVRSKCISMLALAMNGADNDVEKYF